MTGHYFDDDIFLRNRTLTIRHLPGSHSNETIANCFIDVLTEFDIASKLRCMTLDNAKNCIHVGEIVNYGFNCVFLPVITGYGFLTRLITGPTG